VGLGPGYSQRLEPQATSRGAASMLRSLFPKDLFT
jgi:hypothetical protein